MFNLTPTSIPPVPPRTTPFRSFASLDDTDASNAPAVALRAQSQSFERLMRASSERLDSATRSAQDNASACRLAFDSVYVLLAAAATGDELAGLHPRNPKLAAQGAKRLGLSRQDQELAKGLASVYTCPGWGDFDPVFLFEWASRLTSCIRANATLTKL